MQELAAAQLQQPCDAADRFGCHGIGAGRPHQAVPSMKPIRQPTLTELLAGSR